MSNYPKHEPIAVIGMSCVFPKAPDVKAFWQNILNGVNAIGDPLPEWEADRYLANGTITTSKGGYLKDLFRFNPVEFGIMPSSVDGGEPDQLLALQVAKRALEDAGQKYLAEDFDHRDTGIVLGHSTYYHRGQVNAAQHNIILDQTIDILKAALPGMSGEQEKEIYDNLKKQLPQFNADMCPSEVPNVMTGRIANRLNFTGPNYLVDAACSSSLLAVNSAIEELRSGNSRMMLAGGVNASLPAEVSVIFTLLDALSEKGKVRPFEEGSDGTLLGEGLGVVVLKRLSDACEDGDRIYSIVHGVGQSSDGKGLGLLAPSQKGQVIALERAYAATGIDPKTISLVEAHGTGISLGDQTEIGTLKAIFGEREGEQGNIALGSVKSMISHCIPAAGMASFIKTSLALYHKILPPTLCDKVNPDLAIEQTPFYINNTIKPWIVKNGQPRRAAINSFGFGGVNTHAILEEAPDIDNKPLNKSPRSHELFIFASDNKDGLKIQLNDLSNFIHNRDDVYFADIAYSLSQKDGVGNYRLALIASDVADLNKKIEQAIKRLDKSDKPLMGKGGVVFSSSPVSGKMAFMFPGEGSQYMNMLSDLAIHFEPVRKWFNMWSSIYDSKPGSNRTDLVFPANSELTDERRKQLEQQLHQMDEGSEAVFIAGQAMNSLLNWLGVSPDVMLGHSSGESSALVASNAIAWDSLDQIGKFIRKLNEVSAKVSQKGDIATGSLMAIALMSRDKIAEQIKDSQIEIAMENCPTQTIVFGQKADIKKLSDKLSQQGAICEILPFDRGYHTSYFEPMRKAFAKYYKDINLDAPEIPLYSCASADTFPNEQSAVQALAARQWAQNVRFVETIEKMYEDGIRYFIEVGPSGKLTSFAEQILKKKEGIIAASNVDSQAGLPQLLNLMAKLFVNGKANIDKLFAERDVNLIDLNDLKKPKPRGMMLKNTMPRLHATQELTELLQTIAPQQISINVAPQHSIEKYCPFISEISELSDTSFKGFSYLNVKEDLFLQDHILSGQVSDVNTELHGLSCVPMMVSIEIMAEACAQISGSCNLTIIENVKTFDWIALDSGEVNLEVNAEKYDNKYKAQILNKGSVIIEAEFVFDDYNFQCQPLAPLTEHRPFSKWPNEYELYEVGMYHGPIFQTIPNIIGWNDDGIDANLAPASLQDFFRLGETPSFIINPALLDAASQLPAFRDAEIVGRNFYAFPTRIQRIELYSQCPQNIAGMQLSARKTSLSKTSRSWDFECKDCEGNALFRISSLNDIFFTVPENFRQVLHQPLESWLGAPTTSGGWYIEYLPKNFCAQSDGIFLRMLAHCFLNESEQGQLSDDESIFRYIAIKEATRYWIYQQTGELLYPTDIEVSFDINGQVQLYGWWCEEEYYIISPPEISLQIDNKSVLVEINYNNEIVGYG